MLRECRYQDQQKGAIGLTVMLCYLITSREIRIKIVLPIEGRAQLYLRVEGYGGSEGKVHTFRIKFLLHFETTI